jgi:hypothetical protein
VVVEPWLTTTRSVMYFASSVAVPVAPGTPGIGNVTTGLPDSHETDVCPTFARPSAKSVPGLAPSQKVSVVPARAALAAPWGLAQRRMSRSCTAAGIADVVPFVGPMPAPGVSSFQAYSPLTTSMFDTF